MSHFHGNDVSIDGTLTLLDRGFDVSKMTKINRFTSNVTCRSRNEQGKSAADRYRELSKGALVDTFTSHRLSVLLTLEKRYPEAQRSLLEALQLYPADDLLGNNSPEVSLFKPAKR